MFKQEILWRYKMFLNLKNKKVKMMTILSIMTVLMAITSCTSKSPVAPPEPPEPKLLLGVLYAALNDDVHGKALDEFIETYAEYDLTITFYNERLGNSFRFSFDDEKIDKFEFLEMIKNDQRVISATILPNWIQGLMDAQLHDHVRDEALEEFLFTYSEYELKIVSQILTVNIFTFSFNMELVDEFDLLDMMWNDDRVIWAGFDYIIDIDNKHKAKKIGGFK